MSIDFFISKLKEIKPSKEAYFKNNNKIMPKSFEFGYLLKRRKPVAKKIIEENDIIGELISKYQTRYLGFGYYTFNDDITELEGYYASCENFEELKEAKIFGRNSGTFLLYDSPYSEVMEYSTDELVPLYHCAKDSAAFLEAILHLQEMYALRLEGSIERDDDEINHQFLNKCINSAGGQKFASFYEMIIF